LHVTHESDWDVSDDVIDEDVPAVVILDDVVSYHGLDYGLSATEQVFFQNATLSSRQAT